MSELNICELIFTANQVHLDKTAIVESTRRISYGELQSIVEEVAAELRINHIQEYDRVALLCHDSIDYVVLSLAVLRINAAIVPMAPDLMSDERTTIPDCMDVHFILADTLLSNDPSGIILSHSLRLDRTIRLISRTASKTIREHYTAIRPAFIRFSSGTTGASKGVVLSHKTIIERTDAANDGLHVTSADTIAWVLSMSFHFVVTILLFLRKGATLVICGNPILDAMARTLQQHEITLIYASPIHYRLLTTSASITSKNLKYLRMAVSTAVHLPEQIAQDFVKRFNIHLTEAYGVIEVGLPFVHQHGEAFRSGHLGQPLPSYTVTCTQNGEVLIRGKGLFDGYFSPWHPYPLLETNGWFNTGDVGELSPDGSLTLIGRMKAVINFSGMKIFPQEVEEVLNRFPSVAESCVYGEPHPEYGQLPCAKLVLTPDTKTFNERELLVFCRSHLSTHKIPKSFTCVDALPKTASGKIRRC